jgi:hypothetical protein
MSSSPRKLVTTDLAVSELVRSGGDDHAEERRQQKPPAVQQLRRERWHPRECCLNSQAAIASGGDAEPASGALWETAYGRPFRALASKMTKSTRDISKNQVSNMR